MKRLLILLAAMTLLCCCKKDLNDVPYIKSDNPSKIDWKASYAYVFDSSVIPEIHLGISTDEWNRLLQAYDKQSSTKEYIACDVTYIKDGAERWIPAAGVRLRGNTSRRRPEGSGGQSHKSNGADWHHCHFSLGLHHYYKNAEHTLYGIRQVDLKWFKEDPAYVREIYCYDLFRRFGVWTAINDIYARLWIQVGNDKEAYFGVYGMLEHIDREYIYARAKQFGSTEGSLWKCSYGADLRRTDNDFGEDDNTRDHVYELKYSGSEFQQAKTQIKDFISKLNSLRGDELYGWLESVIDIDLLLRTYAVNVAVGMWDDYWNNSNNYYLYFTPEGRMFFIPFDYDNTIGTSHVCGVQKDSGRQDPYKWGQSSNPLISTILSKAEWKALYKQYLQELCGDGGLNSAEAAKERILEWQSQISSFVPNDTGEDMSISDKPASWGNHPEYRIMAPGTNNFFTVKAATVAAMK